MGQGLAQVGPPQLLGSGWAAVLEFGVELSVSLVPLSLLVLVAVWVFVRLYLALALGGLWFAWSVCLELELKEPLDYTSQLSQYWQVLALSHQRSEQNSDSSLF